MNILILYDKHATNTGTVFQHLDSFRKHSKFNYFYTHAQQKTLDIELKYFDVIIIHYSIRVAYKLLTKKTFKQISEFKGLKILFVQDEYEHTNEVIKAIKSLNIKIFFTCVPKKYIQMIYPKKMFRAVDFVQNLTGYVSESNELNECKIIPIKNRERIIGYRGNNLAFHYGDLGQEKKIIAQKMKELCKKKNINCDISYEVRDRIYGKKWTEFLLNSKATLGTESGSNLFDYNGEYKRKFLKYLKKFPNADYKLAKFEVLGSFKEKKIMNQISPRIFEAIESKTALVLFEGVYSNIVKKNIHFIPLKKDFSNFDDVLDKLSDNDYLQCMVNRAFNDIVKTNKFTYKKFIDELDSLIASKNIIPNSHNMNNPYYSSNALTKQPISLKINLDNLYSFFDSDNIVYFINVLITLVVRASPRWLKNYIKFLIKKIRKKLDG